MTTTGSSTNSTDLVWTSEKLPAVSHPFAYRLTQTDLWRLRDMQEGGSPTPVDDLGEFPPSPPSPYLIVCAPSHRIHPGGCSRCLSRLT